jgi:hypothetical protein
MPACRTFAMEPSFRRTPALLVALAWATCIPPLTGCFDGGAVVEAQQHESAQVRMDEIAIGQFRITLPQVPGALSGGTVEFQAFGRVAARDRDKVFKGLLLNAPELRHRVLLAVRGLTPKQLEEPNLATLRSELTKLANAALDEKLIKSVGFQKFSFTTL